MKAKKLPSGNFRVQVVAGYDENGKRIVKSFTDSEEWRAIKRATDYLEEITNTVNPDATVAMAMERYIKSHKNVVEETTVRNYNQILKHRFKSIPDKYAMERGGWATDNILKSVYQQTFSSERKKIDKIIDGYFTGIIMGTENAETA